MQTYTELYNALKPLIQGDIDLSIEAIGFSAATPTTSSDSGLSARVSALETDVETFAYSGLGLSNTDTGTTYTLILTSSSYPGAVDSILATDSSGKLGVQRLGIGNAGNASYALYSGAALQSYFADDVLIGTTTSGTGNAKLHVLTTGFQAQFSYDASNYSLLSTGSTGAFNIASTGGTPANAHIYLNPGGGSANVGIGNSIPAPTAKLEVNSTTEQLRLAYSATVYTSLTVASTGVLTLASTAGTPANANILISAGAATAKVGIGDFSGGGPNSHVEIRKTSEQLRLSYSNGVYAHHTVSSAGNLTIAITGGNLYTTSSVAHPSYVSQLSYWRITSIGEADFRYIYTDELHAKAFIADLEQALAGGQIITKSVAKISADFAVPTAGNTGNLDVEAFAGFGSFQVFVNGDLIRIRQFDRSGGGLKISDIWGTVVWVSNFTQGSLDTPCQRYTFTRHATYPGTGSGTITAGTLALDYGTSDNGYLEANAIDGSAGANSPYYQIVTWNTHPKSTTGSQGLKLRLRMGQLRGLTGANQWGIYAGTGWSANPNEGNVSQYSATTPTVNDAHRYILAGDNGVNIYNADLQVYSSTTPVITLDRSTPYLAVGSASDAMTFTTGNAGFWVGNVSGTYKSRMGSVSGGVLTQGYSWDGSRLNVIGSISLGPATALNYGPSIGNALLMARFDNDSTAMDGTVATITGGVTYFPAKFGRGASVAQATTNVVTNPSFETNTTGWTVFNNSGTLTTSRSTERAWTGLYSFKMVATGSTPSDFVRAQISGLSASTAYTVSVWMNITAFTGPAGSNRALFCFDTANSGATGQTATVTAATNGWVRISVTVTMTASPGDLEIRLYTPQGTVYFDAVQAEAKAAATPYCDGTLSAGHSWSGTAHASTSSRTGAVINYTKTSFLHAGGTVASWVRLANVSGVKTVFRIDSTGSNLISIRANNASAQGFWGVSGGVILGGTLVASTWHHIAITFDGTTLTLYVDGVSVNTGAQTAFFATDSTFRVGAYDSSTQHLDGEMDDLLVTDRILTADEIRAIYSSNAPVSVDSSPFSLYLYGESASGYVRGNASGLFGYSDTTNGAGTGMFAMVTTASTALGVPFGSVTLDAGDVMLGSASSGKSNILWDNGSGLLSLRVATTTRMYLDTSGNLLLGNNVGNNLYWDNSASSLSVRASSTKRIELTSAGVLNINNSSGTTMIKLDGSGNASIENTLAMGASGVINVGSSDTILDASGITIKAVTAYADINTLKWKYSSNITASLYSIVDTGAPVSSTLVIKSVPYSGGTFGYLDLNANSSSNAAVRLLMSGTPNSATRGPDATFTFYNTSATKIGGNLIYCSTAGTSGTMTAASAVRYRMHYRLVVRASGGNLTTLTGDLAVNASTTVTVGGTASDFRVGVHSTGYIYWDRVAGAETYEVTFWAIYI